MTRSVLTALTAGLMIGGGLLFVGGVTAGVLWMSDRGPVQTAAIPMPPPPQATLSPGVTVDPEPAPERPQVFTPPPAPPEPEPNPATAPAPAPVTAPPPPVAAGPAPPSPLKPSDLDARPPQSILSMVLTPVPPDLAGSTAAEPPPPSRPTVPSVLSPAASPSQAPVRPQVSAAMPAAPATAPAKPAAQKPEPARPAEKPAPVKDTAAKAAKPEPKADAKPAPKTDTKPAAEPLAVQWQDGTASPAVGSVTPAGGDRPPQTETRQAAAPQGSAPQTNPPQVSPPQVSPPQVSPPQVSPPQATPPQTAPQPSVMDALTLPQAPVGSRVEVAADGQRQTITTRTPVNPATVARGTVAVRSGVFAQDENVRSRLAELKAIGLSGSVYSFTNNAGKTMKVVEVGRYSSRKAAAPVIAKLKAHKLEVYVADPP